MTIELDPVEVPRGGATTGRRPGYARTSPTSTAGISDDATALVHWREAVRPFQDADNLGNAGLTACYGAWTALRRSSPAEAAELFLTAADLHRRAGDLDREVWALIGLTAAYAEVGQHAQARDVLTSLHQRISGRPRVAPRCDDRAGPAHRRAGLPRQRRGPAAHTDADPPAPEETSYAAGHLGKVSAALYHPEAEKDVLREFAESPMVYEPPSQQPWIHQDLGEELTDQPQLE